MTSRMKMKKITQKIVRIVRSILFLFLSIIIFLLNENSYSESDRIEDMPHAAAPLSIEVDEPKIDDGLRKSGIIAKSKISGIGIDGEAILSDLIKNGILEEVSLTEVRLRTDNSLNERNIQEIVKSTDDFEKVWGILQQFQLVNSVEETETINDSENNAGQLGIEAVTPIKASELISGGSSLGLANLEDGSMGNIKISSENNADKTRVGEFVSVDKLVNSKNASVSVRAKDKAIDTGKINSQVNTKAKSEKDASNNIRVEKVKEQLIKMSKQIDNENLLKAVKNELKSSADNELPLQVKTGRVESQPGNDGSSMSSPKLTGIMKSDVKVIADDVAPHGVEKASPERGLISNATVEAEKGQDIKTNWSDPSPQPVVIITSPVTPATPSPQPVVIAKPPVVTPPAPLSQLAVTTTVPVIPSTYENSLTVMASEGLSPEDNEEGEASPGEHESSPLENDEEDEEGGEDDEELFEADYPEDGIIEGGSCHGCEQSNKKKNMLNIRESVNLITDKLFSSSDKTEQISLAKERKQKFLDLMENDPAAAIDSAILGARSSDFPAGVRENMEKRDDVEGILETEYQCDVKQGTEKISYFINGRGERFSLYFSGSGSSIPLSGSRVKILDGLILDDRVALDSVSADNFKIISSKKYSDAGSKQKIAAILFNFNNDTRKPFTKKEVLKMFKQLRKFIRKNSYRKFDLEFSKDDIYGWYTIESNSTICDQKDTGCVPAPECDKSSVDGNDTWRELAKNMASADSEHPFPTAEGSYDKIFYFQPRLGCGYNGVAGESQITMNGSISYLTAAHEFGHTLGFRHAENYVCTEDENDCTSANNSRCIERYKKTAISNYCLTEAYGDPYDVMAYGRGHYSAYCKRRMGWIGTGNMKTVTDSGSYEVAPLEDESSGTQLLAIPRGERTIDDIKQSYYVEYLREYISKDSKSEGGIVVRLAPADLTVKDITLLIDTASETFTAKDALLKKGGEFKDEIAGIKIQVSDISSDNAKLEIEVNQDSNVCLRTDPGIDIEESSASQGCIKRGESLEYVLTVTNNDGVGCSASNFEITSNLNEYLSQEPSSLSVTIEPGDSIAKNIVISLTDGANSRSGYKIEEKATHVNSSDGKNATDHIYIYECENEEDESDTQADQAEELVVLIGSVRINNGADYASSGTVILSLQAEDGNGDVSKMKLSDKLNVNWDNIREENYTNIRQWNFLPHPNGVKNVYVRFKGLDGKWTDVYSAGIILDNSAPYVDITKPLSNFQYETINSSISLSGIASDATSGIDHVDWINYHGGGGWASGTTNWLIPNVGLFSGDNIIKVTAYDKAGNFKDDIITVRYSKPQPVVVTPTPVALPSSPRPMAVTPASVAPHPSPRPIVVTPTPVVTAKPPVIPSAPQQTTSSGGKGSKKK